MIPVRDNIHARRFPVVNTTLIIVNVLVFFFEASLGTETLQNLIQNYGLTSYGFWTGGAAKWLTIFTSMFLHGSWIHVLSNMLALYIFGDNVEDRLGHARYLVFYLLGGAMAALAHIWAYPTSPLPTVGASGAIAAVLGGYLILFPTAKVYTLVPLFFVWMVDIPAVVYLAFWFLSQVFNGALALAADTFQGGGVAWWAHVGGFISGMVMVRLFALRTRRRDYPDEYYPW